MADSNKYTITEHVRLLIWAAFIIFGSYYFWYSGPHFGSTKVLYLSQIYPINGSYFRVLQKISFRPNANSGEVTILREEPDPSPLLNRIPTEVTYQRVFECTSQGLVECPEIEEPWRTLRELEEYFATLPALKSIDCAIYNSDTWSCEDALEVYSLDGPKLHDVGYLDGTLTFNPSLPNIGGEGGGLLNRGQFANQLRRCKGICLDYGYSFSDNASNSEEDLILGAICAALPRDPRCLKKEND